MERRKREAESRNNDAEECVLRVHAIKLKAALCRERDWRARETIGGTPRHKEDGRYTRR